MIAGGSWVDYPKELTPALSEVLGLDPGFVIVIAGAMRQVGFTIAHHYEEENAAVRHFLIPYAIEYEGDWRRLALEHLKEREAEQKAALNG